MTKQITPIRETMKQAGYEYVQYSTIYHAHVLKELETGKLELWTANKGHASYGIIYKNTHLEFVSEYIPHYGIPKETLYAIVK